MWFTGLYGDQFVCFAFNNQSKLLFSTLKPEYKMYNVDIPGIVVWSLLLH